jgi:hypothetical protein
MENNSKADKLIWMAENELTEYSTEARKIEKLRRKFSFVIPYPEQQAVRDQIAATLSKNPIMDMVEQNRQTVALPFWGIGGLGLLFGISFQQPIDFVGTVFGFVLAYQIQKWGWTLEAKRLVIKTLDDIDFRVKNPED